MSENNNNLKYKDMIDSIFNSADYDESMKIVLNNSPSKKINITQNDVLFILGFNLMLRETSKIKYDFKDLNMSTVVFIENYHLLECISILSGAFHCANLALQQTVDYNKYIKQIMDINNLIYYKDLIKLSDNICVDFINNCGHIENKETKSDIIDRLRNLIRNIWFLPYTEIDLLKNAIKKELSGDDNNG